MTWIRHIAGPPVSLPDGMIQKCLLCGATLTDSRGEQTIGGGNVLLWREGQPVNELEGESVLWGGTSPGGVDTLDCRFVRRA